MTCQFCNRSTGCSCQPFIPPLTQSKLAPPVIQSTFSPPKLTRGQALLIKLAEECNEVAQEIAKLLWFGANEICPGQPYTNAERVARELADMMGVISILIQNNLIDKKIVYDVSLHLQKIEKVAKYLQISRECGVLDSTESLPPAPIRIYVASKCKHAKMWKELRSRPLPITSTWIDEAGAGETVDTKELWVRVIREASTATALLFYSEDGEIQKGGLVEVGAALSHGVPVYAVGPIPGTWHNHPLVQKCFNVDEALSRIYNQST